MVLENRQTHIQAVTNYDKKNQTKQTNKKNGALLCRLIDKLQADDCYRSPSACARELMTRRLHQTWPNEQADKTAGTAENAAFQ